MGGATFQKTGENYWLAKTQTYINSKMQDEGGDSQREWIADRLSDYIVKETTMGEYMVDRTAGNKNQETKPIRFLPGQHHLSKRCPDAVQRALHYRHLWDRYHWN